MNVDSPSTKPANDAAGCSRMMGDARFSNRSPHRLAYVAFERTPDQNGSGSDAPGKLSTSVAHLPRPRQPAGQLDPHPGATMEADRILKAVIIEDNPDLQEILIQLLGMLGHEAVGAGDGGNGIARARELRPDVILCDIGLPDMSGYEVARIIRTDPDLKTVFLVALSGYAQPEDLEKSREAGFDRHLAKPVDLETLKSVLVESSGRA